jgi:preprotein translocase subunit SecB
MKLQLKKCLANEINFVGKENIEGFDTFDEFGIHHEPNFSHESEVFSIEFKVRLKVQDTHLLLVNYISIFEYDCEDDSIDDFSSSDFPYVNAPAIAFPYLRSLVSTLLLNAGFEPTILPSINFSAMHEGKKP